MKRILFIHLALFTCLSVSAQTATTQFSHQQDDSQLRQEYSNNSVGTATEFIEGTTIIKVKEGIGPYALQKSNISFGISSLDKMVQAFRVSKLEKRFKHKPIAKNSGLPDLSRIYRIEFPKTQNVLQVAQAFASDPNIEYAEAVPIYRTAEVPNDSLYSAQQHLPQIMASEAWDVHKGEDGDEIVVAIVDTGVDWLHPDLTENCWQNLGEDADGDGVTLEYNDGVWERDPDDLNGVDDDGNGFVDDVIGWDFHEEVTIGDGSNPDPIWNQGPYEHGTHCAGIAACRTNNGDGISSVSYNVKYMPLQASPGANAIPYGWDAIIYASENGADIISNSWGGPNYSEVGRETIEYAVGMGSIVVVAAHNYNTDKKYYPAAYHGSVSVSALNPDDTRASFTNYGAWLDIAAPGVSILSSVTNNNYASWNGTSMATPMVAGLFALLKSYQPDWTNDQLIEQIIGTADDIDYLNPAYEKALGSGRINAYHALVDENVEVPQELRLELIDYSITDESDNGALEAGETATMSCTFRNFAHLVGDDNATFTLLTNDPDIIITKNSISEPIPVDDNIDLEFAFTFRVAEDAKVHVADLTIEISSDKTLTYGSKTELEILVAASGFFVWDGDSEAPDYSGKFIKNYLEQRGHDVVYSNTFPKSFFGFDAVFLSFGNSGEDNEDATVFTDSHSLSIQQYLEDGGNVYCEGSPFFFFSDYYSYPNHDELEKLFGVTSGWGEFIENPISTLSGIDGSMHEGMVFSTSYQTLNWYIDKLVATEGATVSFNENDYGNVSIYNEGEYGQKTFYLAYSLADLHDQDLHSSRCNILVTLLDFLGYPENDGYVIANFKADKNEVEPDEEIHFTDWTLVDEGYDITNWEWDFNEDGIIDSYDQNPIWAYATGGKYDVKLIVAGDQDSDTLVIKDFITVRSGILVYDGIENMGGYSGTFIKEYLLDHWYSDVNYTNTFPMKLSGYDAVFLSFGNNGYLKTSLNAQMEGIIYDYCLGGGKVYIEGGDVLFEGGLLWQVFGLSNVEAGELNNLTDLAGMESSIAGGLYFDSSTQAAWHGIDKYEISSEFPGVEVAFEESDYGAVAFQVDGTQTLGHKTFCMSYALADLEDGTGLNTRNELLSRILNFFDVVADVEEPVLGAKNDIKVYPNPTSSELTISGIPVNSNIYLTDLTGNLLMTLKAGTSYTKLSISELPKGLYILQTVVGTKKIVKM